MQSNNSPLHQVLKEYINITIILHLSPDQSSYATHTFYSNLSRILVWFVTKGDSYMPCKAMALSPKLRAKADDLLTMKKFQLAPNPQ